MIDYVKKLLLENSQLKRDNERLRTQWEAAIDRSIDNDRIIMNLTEKQTEKQVVNSATQTECEEPLPKKGRETWLNDAEIWNELKDLQESNDILFLHPSVCIQIMHDDDVSSEYESLNLLSYKMILAPISDCKLDPSINGNTEGTHWSLIAINPNDKAFLHFDSIPDYNNYPANVFYNKMSKVMNIVGTSTFKQAQCRRQEDSYSCGWEVIRNAKLLVDKVRNNPKSPSSKKWLNLQMNFRRNSDLEKINYDNNDFSNMSNSLQVKISQQQQQIQKLIKEISKLKRRIIDLCSDTYLKSNNDYKVELNTRHNTDRRNVLILADSHGRNLSCQLKNYLRGDHACCGFIYPGASLSHIANKYRHDYVLYPSHITSLVVLGGTNNFTKTSTVTDIELYILSLKNFISRHKDIEIILSTIPYRYDLRESSTENTLIREANIQISKLCRTESIKLIDLWTLPRRFHTNHGLHFNKIGKSHIVREIRAFLRADCLTINERNIEVQTLNLNSSDPIDSVKVSDLSTQKKQSLTNYNSSEIINQGSSSREDINNDFPSVDNNSSLVTNNCQVTCAISSHTTSLNSLVLERELIT
ncbi:hypothetical protein LSTR_LSTR015636 [Laodelphax striatellus]|uniref:Ubiquitin-like protease family profile domain-containing protein n=1 Tax=Laodelphax striatellus TaxID=195883 RepID=A0A482WGB9_LAOST|nr:hypothetical protein LSTR_LSTR015636 [Laodelphax striatellus]